MWKKRIVRFSDVYSYVLYACTNETATDVKLYLFRNDLTFSQNIFRYYEWFQRYAQLKLLNRLID